MTLVFLCCTVLLGIEKHILKRGFRKMKKLIATLVIAIVLVGAVFATDNAALKISVSVDEYVPTFKLGTSDSTYITSQVFDLVVADGADTATAATATAAAGTKLANGESLTITFGIFQVRNAVGYIKTDKAYGFEVDATDLVLTTAADTDDPEENEMFERGTITAIASAANAPSSEYATITTATSSAPYKIDYTGKKYTPAAETEVANFSVTWNANDTALSGTYEAYVTLTMTTT